jgi:ATP-dependent helicase/nuclease subunit B
MPPHSAGARVFSIPAGAAFVPVLAEAILDGRLVSLDRSDPLALADLTVFLPTRRAVRALRDALAERLGTAILPQIRPLGDIDEDEALLAPADETTGELLVLPPAISFLSRRLALTRLVLAWRRELRRSLLPLGEGEEIGIPASAADAARLARDLARLGDDMAIAGVAWDAVARLAGGDQAGYFQITLDFLKIVAEQWPAYLAETSRLDPAARRDQLIRARAAALAREASPKPFIVAGSTGSMPATAELIRTVARLPNGAVVLPGVDRDLDEAGWATLGNPGEADAAEAHPQFGLKQLVSAIGVSRSEIKDLAPAPSAARSALLSAAMRSAGTAERWTAFAAGAGALDGVSLIVARNEQEEATAIALAIREAVAVPGTSVALVTPDRMLARRVAAELGRWGLAVDDSAGGRLDREPAGVLARLLLEAASEPSALKLLALAKHPLAAFGMSRAACRQAARALELGVLRGRRVAGGLDRLPEAVAVAKAEVDGKDAHVPRWRRLGDSEWRLAAQLVGAISAAMAPLAAALSGKAEISATATSALLQAALCGAATDDTGSDAQLHDSASGRALDALLASLNDTAEAAGLMLAPVDAPFLLAELLRDVVVPRPALGEFNVHIWGTLEARLQAVDLVILGGLDEGVWPAATRTDPWLSRAMRADVGLPSPERRTGLAAHDFIQALAAPRVIVTRAEKRQSAPTVPSRWLQRIAALADDTTVAAMTGRGSRYVTLARQIDAPLSAKPQPIERPEPKPPLAARPQHLSITEIETLIRDPYAVYAKHVLRLQPLDPLGAPADARVKGTLVHEALGSFIARWTGPFDESAEARLVEIMREVLTAVADAPDVLAVWSFRFAAIARWFVGFEAGRRDVRKRHAEIAGMLPVPTPSGTFTLNGRADRIDVLNDESLAIYDFKTGTPQSDRTVFAGLTPQMTLEAAMARRGGFVGVTAGRSVRELAWLAVGKCGRDDPYVSAVLRGQTADDLADRAFAMLQGLVAAYADRDRGYLSRARPMMERDRYFGDYDHLARVREWALVESAEDVAL